MSDAVSALWALLDEMAEQRPQLYRQLQREQRHHAQRYCGRPEPRLCLRALPVPAERLPASCPARGAARGPLFVNVCGWSRVPRPAEPQGRIPVIAGPMEAAGGDDSYSVIDIAYNPDVLRRREENPEAMGHLIHLTLKFIEDQCNLILSHSYEIESFKLKGSPDRMWQRLKSRQPPPPLGQDTLKELTLDQLLHSIEAEDHSAAPVLLKEGSTTQSKVQLIEEISSTEVPEELSTPAYEMSTVRDANNKPVRIELKVELPEVSSVSECDLGISKDDVIIDVPEKYKLQLDLPELVDEETTTAVFNKGKGVLFITMPVAKAGQ